MSALAMEMPVRSFVEVSEVWVPKGDRLVWSSGSYGALDRFAAASEDQSFAKGEGLPGRAWAEARPVVLKAFDGSYFCRTEAAKAAGLTSGVGVPIFAGAELKAVLVVLCSEDALRKGAIEVWGESDGLLTLADGYYGAARDFEQVSQDTTFSRGQGLPGGVWAANTPILMRDLGAGYGFMRAASAGKAGLTTGLGLPIAVPGHRTYVLTLLSGQGTPIAERFEIWDARPTRTGSESEAVLVDGICRHEGPLWTGETEQRVTAWQGPIGQVLGSGIPLVTDHISPRTPGYASMVAVPLYRGDAIAYVVTWYS